MSRIVTCDPVTPAADVIKAAVEALIDGSAVVMPTETQYSLSVRGDDERAPAKIRMIKQRGETVAVALFVKDLTMAKSFCDINETARRLAEKYLPGPLTLVLPAKKGQVAVASAFASPDGFGIRLSSSPVIAAVMERAPFAVTATSANISGEMTPSTVGEINRVLGERVDLYLDAGPCRGVIPSTVVRVGDGVTVLRPGVIPETEIRRYLGEAV